MNESKRELILGLFLLGFAFMQLLFVIDALVSKYDGPQTEQDHRKRNVGYIVKSFCLGAALMLVLSESLK